MMRFIVFLVGVDQFWLLAILVRLNVMIRLLTDWLDHTIFSQTEMLLKNLYLRV